jgi:pimeloyl-ACP methyl ester carboxylesterase
MPYVTTNKIRLFYEECGSGDPLILIMGLGAPGSLWEEHVASYEQYFRCYVIDNRGAGKSDQPMGPYSTKMMADDVAGLMQGLGITDARIAGISMGSGIAQELGLNYPNLVRSLVLISSWSRCDAYTRTIFEHFKQMRALASPAEFSQLLQLWIASPGYFEDQYNKMLQDQIQAKDNYMGLQAFTAQSDACITHNTFDRLGQLKIPALLTVGDADIFTPLRLTVEMHERMPLSRVLVFEGNGHIHHWEDSVRFNAETLQFLRDH